MQKLLFPDIKKAPLLTYSDTSSCSEIIWEEGERIDKKAFDLTNLVFVCETLPINKMTDFSVTDTGCIIISGRLKSALLNNGGNHLSYYPASVVERTGEKPKNGFYAVNIETLVDCIDIERSQFKGRIIDGELRGIRRIHQLFLTTPISPVSSIYRVKLFRRLIVVSDDLITLFESNEFSGMKLVEPTLWDGFCGESVK